MSFRLDQQLRTMMSRAMVLEAIASDLNCPHHITQIERKED